MTMKKVDDFFGLKTDIAQCQCGGRSVIFTQAFDQTLTAITITMECAECGVKIKGGGDEDINSVVREWNDVMGKLKPNMIELSYPEWED